MIITIILYLGPTLDDACSTPDRRQTFIKNQFDTLKPNDFENFSRPSDILPYATFTPERRMTYVKNAIVPINSSKLSKFSNSQQEPVNTEENINDLLHESPILDPKFEVKVVDQKFDDVYLCKEAVKKNFNLSLEIPADCLLLTPDTTKAKGNYSVCPRDNENEESLDTAPLMVDQKENVHSEDSKPSSHTSVEKECDKDSSKDTYVVDEPTIASLDDITEEGSLADITENNEKESSLHLSQYCKLSDTIEDITTQNELIEHSVLEKIIDQPENFIDQSRPFECSDKNSISLNMLPLPEKLEDQIQDIKIDDISQLIAIKVRLSRETNGNHSKELKYNSEISPSSAVVDCTQNKSNNSDTFDIIQTDSSVDDRKFDQHQSEFEYDLMKSSSIQKPISLNCNKQTRFSADSEEDKENVEKREPPNDLALNSKQNMDETQEYPINQTIMETNQDVQRNSFLMDTVVEENFAPPNPGTTKYCSTAYKKDRTRESREFPSSSGSVMQEKEKSSEIVRTLFINDKKDVKAKVSLFEKGGNHDPNLDAKELASETWVIPIEQAKIQAEQSENKQSTNISSKYKPPTNLKNRVSLNPLSSKSNSTNKSINSSKMLIKSKPINPRLTLIKPLKSRNTIHHPNPHAAQNMYYDERWIEKQENGFKKWLNFVLTPPEGFDEAGSQSELLRNGKLDVAKLWSACTKDVKVPRAPTREVLSLRAYTVQREINRLRRNACTLLQSPDVANVLAKLEYEIEQHRFEMRKDKAIHKDVGMKKKFLILILNYNPLWLRIGLETVFGRIIPMNGAADFVTLSKFIIRDFLNNPDILAMFAHPTVPHHYSEGYEIKLKQFVLKKFFNLVLFLDQAKKYKMIKHNPCLFNKDSPIKMSRDIITSFSRDFLSGEGDVMKHLGYLGFKVDHKQTHLDEFDFAITNIAIDIRCGVRLCRLMEILTKNQKLTESLRLPASTRMQKIHNVGVALKALENSAAGAPPENPTPKDIVDGHLQKTLDLLWHVIFGFQIGQLLSIEHLSNEISYLEKTLNHEVRIGNKKAQLGWNFYLDCKRRKLKDESDNGCPKGWLGNERIMLLLKWAQLVCAHYGLEIENLSVSFSDGRGLCLLVHHYHPNFLPMNEIHLETTQTQQGNSNGPKNLNGSFNDSFGQTMTYTYAKSSDYAGTFEKLLKNEKENFKTLHNKTKELGGIPILIKSDEMSNTIPDLKVTTTFITYLAARLLDLSTEMKAARTIQLAWKRFLAIRNEEKMKVRYQ